MRAIWLGRVDYEAAWSLQRELVALRSAEAVGDHLLLLEHPPTVTMGRAASADHLLVSRESMRARGVACVETDRGGDVTYHGPGQIVGYPIVSLDARGRDLHGYLRTLEEGLIGFLRAVGLAGTRKPPHTGVWIADRKIAAIGVHVRRWVTSHGFAVNVDPDMSHFGLIVPCGIREYGVTSLRLETGRAWSSEELLAPLAGAIGAQFPGAVGAGPAPDLLCGRSAKIVAQAIDVSVNAC